MRIKVVRKDNMRIRNRRHQRYKGLFMGAMSGLAGTILMTQFQNVWNKVSEETQDPKSKVKAKRAKPEKKEEKEDSTMKAAGKISEEIGHPLSRKERKKAGPWVHYSFGTSVGAVFGLAAEMAPDSVRAINPALVGPPSRMQARSPPNPPPTMITRHGRFPDISRFILVSILFTSSEQRIPS